MATPDIHKLGLSDSDNEDLFASPSRASKPSKPIQKDPHKTKEPTNTGLADSGGNWEHDAEQLHEISLQKELANVQKVNELIDGVNSSLEHAKGQMEVSRRVGHVNSSRTRLKVSPDSIPHGGPGIYTSQYLDPDPLADRT